MPELYPQGDTSLETVLISTLDGSLLKAPKKDLKTLKEDVLHVEINDTYLLKYFMPDLINLPKYGLAEKSILHFTIEAVNVHTENELRLTLKPVLPIYTRVIPDPCVDPHIDYKVKTLLKIIDLLKSPFEDTPLHINDPNPICEIASWRLLLPKDHIRPDLLPRFRVSSCRFKLTDFYPDQNHDPK